MWMTKNCEQSFYFSILILHELIFRLQQRTNTTIRMLFRKLLTSKGYTMIYFYLQIKMALMSSQSSVSSPFMCNLTNSLSKDITYVYWKISHTFPLKGGGGGKRNVLFGYLTGSVLSPFRRSISLWGTGYQRKFSFQLNPP